jgi:hypothetical protein
MTGGLAMAFRAGRWHGDKPFRAYYLSPANSDEAPFDLTEAFTQFRISIVSDPKLFKLDHEVWVTFNTGHFQKPNQIFIARLFPDLSEPCELVVPGRQAVRKNWAFFRKDGVLHAVYSICPLVVLRKATQSSATKIVFERLGGNGTEVFRPVANLTLGSQLAALDPHGNEFATIVHRRYYWGKKRAYVGLPARLRRNGESFSVSVGRSHLVHSARSLLGDRPRHNRNLLSCTYFSGLAIDGGRALLSYGINDTAPGFAYMSTEALGFEPRPEV